MIGPNREIVFAYIKQYAKDHPKDPFCAIGTIIEGTGLNRNAVSKGVISLKKSGWIRQRAKGWGYVIITTR